jgi:hypothetical protein
MASKVLSDTDLSKLMEDVNGMDQNKLKALAEEFARKELELKEKRKAYHKNKSPEQKAKQAEYMKKRSAEERERRRIVLAKAKELGLIS